MKLFVLAIQFLTIIPVKTSAEVSDSVMGRCVRAFPLVGFLLGVLAAIAAIPVVRFMPTAVSAVLILLFLNLMTGGFHLDGLSDTVDALSIKSSGDETADRGKRLDIMKDSSSGPAGTSALAFDIIMKYATLSYILETTRFHTGTMAAILVLLPVFGRWAMVPAIVRGSPAGKTGLGRMMMENAGPREFLVALASLLLICGAAAWYIWDYGSQGFAYLLAGLVAMGYLLSEFFHRLGDKIVGGLTGDILGALNETAEIGYLLIITLWLQFYTS